MTKKTEKNLQEMRKTLCEDYERAGRKGEETLNNRIRAFMLHSECSAEDALVAIYEGHKSFLALKPGLR